MQKNRLCNELEYYVWDEKTNRITENRTEEIRRMCLNGGFEKAVGGYRVLAISTSSCRGSQHDSMSEYCLAL